ncbi:hypothetical protein C4577_05640 [Candidatus Parcubacteria bacterium]|nr:MAG: hypothetical protein C4577_05640 [Candidatus Parcubacteria bacterium]
MGHHRSKSPSHRRTIRSKDQVPVPPEGQNPFLRKLGEIYGGESVVTDPFGRRPALGGEIQKHIETVRRGKEY